jgi:hypothetical protein
MKQKIDELIDKKPYIRSSGRGGYRKKMLPPNWSSLAFSCSKHYLMDDRTLIPISPCLQMCQPGHLFPQQTEQMPPVSSLFKPEPKCH